MRLDWKNETTGIESRSLRGDLDLTIHKLAGYGDMLFLSSCRLSMTAFGLGTDDWEDAEEKAIMLADIAAGEIRFATHELTKKYKLAGRRVLDE